MLVACSPRRAFCKTLAPALACQQAWSSGRQILNQQQLLEKHVRQQTGE